VSELATTIRERAEDIGSAVVILCDLSGSMRGKRISRLKEALESLWATMPRSRLIGFGDKVRTYAAPEDLPDEPSGSTPMTAALDMALVLRPAKVIVISDGQPDNEETALELAGKIPGVIDIVFCGDDKDRSGITFMHKLARVGGGRVVIHDIEKTKALLGPVIKDMLALPGAISL